MPKAGGEYSEHLGKLCKVMFEHCRKVQRLSLASDETFYAVADPN